jgi:hypothetical protein
MLTRQPVVLGWLSFVRTWIAEVSYCGSSTTERDDPEHVKLALEEAQHWHLGQNGDLLDYNKVMQEHGGTSQSQESQGVAG